jgi:hypothetical protein
MIASSANSKTRPAVRWPFRAIAAVILVASVAVTFSVVWSIWSPDATRLPLSILIDLPAALMGIRLGYFAAVRGCAPTTMYWPFASGRIVFWYFVVLAFADHFR